MKKLIHFPAIPCTYVRIQVTVMKSEISERATGSEQARETDMLRRARETDGGRKGSGKTVPTLKASCTSTMAPNKVGIRARKTGAERGREKRVGVCSFCGAFLFEKTV